MKQWSVSSSLILIMLISATISLVMLFQQSIRLDEAQSIWMFTKSIPGLLQTTSQDVNLPLYGVILHFWMKIWGTRIEVVRLLSLFFFIFTIPVLFEAAYESSNKQTALLTVALFSFSPFIVWYTSEARTYTLFALITCINHLYYLRMIRSHFKRGKVGYFLSLLLGLYTHYFFFFYIFAQLSYTIILRIKKDIKGKNLLLYSGMVVSGLMWFVPWIIFVILEGSAANTQPIIPTPTSYNIIQTMVNFVFGFQNLQIQSFLVALWPLTLIFLFYSFTQKRVIEIKNMDYFFIMTFLPIALVFLVSFIKPIFLTRYLILTTPSFFFILAWMILNHPRKISFYLASLSMALMLMLGVYQNIYASNPVKEDYGGVVDYLGDKTSAQDVVAISAPFTIYPIEYQYKGLASLDTIPEWDRYIRGSIPPYSQEKLIKQISIYRTKYANMFVVLSYDQGYQNDIQQYLDHHLERLDQKKFSGDIVVSEYKLRYD